MSEIFKSGSSYKNFVIKDVFEVADYHSKAIYLRHKKTGLEVFHLFNDDEENLFSFAFRTPNPASNGAAHIVEHSVLCGSERYPLKDPFIKLSNQSIKTYLNAMTYPDRTVFPASSMIKNDYFNLMSVYADAVFFPKLQKEIFAQEAHRLEIDENGNPIIQGVVYNEMKGSYSSFESVAADCAIKTLLKGSVYEKDSGGDPAEIPSLTYEDFKNFHQKWYRPDNCFLFLYGNIATEEQLDFLQENFLDRIESEIENKTEEIKPENEKYFDEFIKFVSAEPLLEPAESIEIAPCGENEDSGDTVLLNWNLGKPENAQQSLELSVLYGILLNHDGSPLQKALIESGLGEDIAPSTGIENLYNTVLTIGLRGVKKGNAQKVKSLVFETLENLAKNGIAKRDIDSTLMAIDFSQREIKRNHAPFSLRLMNFPTRAWAYGNDIKNCFFLRSVIEKIKLRAKNEKNLFENLITKLLLENKNMSFVTVSPSKKYNENRAEIEREIAESLLKKTSKDKVNAFSKTLRAFQQKADDDSCIPHLRPKDFLNDFQTNKKSLVTSIKTEVKSISGTDGSEIPLFVNRENTNGISYVDVGFPVDVLPPEDYPCLPLLSETISDCGWENMNWAAAAEEIALHTGGFNVTLLSNPVPESSASEQFALSHDWCGRDWLIFRIKMLDEEAQAALSLLSDNIAKVDFSDIKRISDLAAETRNDFASSIIPEGHEYVSMRAKRTFSRAFAADEIFNGITFLFNLQKLSKPDQAEKNAANFKRIFDTLKKSGGFIHLTCEDKNVENLESLLPDFINKIGLKAPSPKYKAADEEFISLTEIKETRDDSKSENLQETEIFVCQSSQVGFASQYSNASPFASKESAAEEVCAHWLSNNLLWETLRTSGGAYGAFCYADGISKGLLFSTYRDPAPFLSADAFMKCVKEASKKHFSVEEIEKAVIGTYSQKIQPKTPQEKGSAGLIRTLYAIRDCDREKTAFNILSADFEEIQRGFIRIYENALKHKTRVIICGKDFEQYGKIAILPL